MKERASKDFRVSVYVRLTETQIEGLQRFLPEQEGVEAKCRYLLSVMVEIALSELRFRIVPCGVQSGRLEYHKIRLAPEVIDALNVYATEGGLDATKQATNLLSAGLELLKQSGQARPLRKEAMKNLLSEFLHERWEASARR